MTNILQSLALTGQWHLMPMLTLIQSRSGDLRSSDLTDKLRDAFERGRDLYLNLNKRGRGPIVFLGMDSPEVDMNEVAGAIKSVEQSNMVQAHICPSIDGGYGMICVSNQAPAAIFDNVRWSCSLTLASQLKALGDAGVKYIRVGKLMQDIDEPQDVLDLADRLCKLRNNNQDETVTADDALLKGSFVDSIELSEWPSCLYTWDTLLKLNIVHLDQDRGLYFVKR